MAHIRTIRRYEGAAVAIGVGVVALLAAVVWRQLGQPRAVLDDDPALAVMETACSEKLHSDARTVSMTPDTAPAPTATVGDPGPAVGARASGDAPGEVAADRPPERRLRLTDYGWAARNTHLRNDPCTKFYRSKLALGR